MSPLRLVSFFLLSLIAGFASVAIFSSLSYPYSEFPIIPILLALALVLRTRPSSFWFIFTIVLILDLYRSAGFGVGILSFVSLVIVGDKIASDLFSHRSIIGCVVISAATGLFWVLFNAFFSQAAYWMHGGSFQIDFLSLLISILIQSGVTAIVVGVFYSVAPRWLRDHSPMNIGGRL